MSGKVTAITKFGAFVALECGKSGLVHISEVANSFVSDVHDFLQAGQEVQVKVLSVTPEGRVNLSVKQALAKMASLMAEDPKHVGRRLIITHCNCVDRAFYLKELVLKQCRFSEILISDTGGIATVYANDGGVVAAY